jgi:uncharacterized cofD-like protein
MNRSMKSPNIVVIGGGTGSFTLLSGLKTYVTDITSLVNMSDDGGSTGKLRDELGVLPPGDVRQCLVALSKSEKLRDLFSYRFNEGSLSGHSFGNLFLSAVEKMTDSFSEAVELAGNLLRIQGRVIPITTDSIHLVMTDSDGNVTKGEYKIGNMNFGENRRPKISIEPNVSISKEAKSAIANADIIVIAPGNLYGSLAPPLVTGGMMSALKSAKAKIVYVCNLVTKPQQTDGFMVHDYTDEIERFIGTPVLDYVIFNTDEPTPAMLKKYTHDGEYPVGFDLEVMDSKHYQAIGLPLIDTEPIRHNTNDKISHNRSLIRHDSDQVARQLMKIYFS